MLGLFGLNCHTKKAELNVLSDKNEGPSAFKQKVETVTRLAVSHS